jgi:hypothetical protein
VESGSLVEAGRSLLLSVATQVSLKSWTSTREKLDVNQTLLAEIVARILTVARPERIILFGSAVSGQAVGMPSSSVRENLTKQSPNGARNGSDDEFVQKVDDFISREHQNRTAFVRKPESVSADFAADQRNSSHPSASRAGGATL